MDKQELYQRLVNVLQAESTRRYRAVRDKSIYSYMLFDMQVREPEIVNFFKPYPMLSK